MKFVGKIQNRLSDTKIIGKCLEAAYLFIFCAILSDMFLHTTMFFKLFGDHTQLHIFMRLGLLLVIFAKLSYTDERDWKNTLLILIVGASFLAAYYRRSRYEELLTIGLLIIGANQVSFRKILKVYTITGIVITIAAMAAAQMGIIENLVYHQKNRSPRNAFGSTYPTDFSAHIVYLVLAYVNVRGSKLKYVEIVSFMLLGMFVQYFCEARTNAGCIFLIAAICLVMKVFHGIKARDGGHWFEKLKKIVVTVFSFLTRYSMMILMTFFVGITLMYTPSNPSMVKWDYFFSKRLRYGKAGFMNYNVGLLGQFIEMHGYGGKTKVPDNYFFIDSSYVKMILCYGLVVTVCIWLIYFIIGKRAQKRNLFYLMTALGIIGIQCMFEHHIIEVAFNPFTLALLAKLDIGHSDREGKSRKELLKWKKA